ncbi:aldehyde dehydrogenase family protein [Streptomyces phaeofaciens]|uniref:aldehyde dehydrogenase family protein n=1 Tax=Streptomyces phaeofaciens TaxID=68254 RepID=UPI00167621B1
MRAGRSASRGGERQGRSRALRYYAARVTKLYGETAPMSHPDVLRYTKREPVGVCAVVDYPLPTVTATDDPHQHSAQVNPAEARTSSGARRRPGGAAGRAQLCASMSAVAVSHTTAGLRRSG